ncbi:MAG: VOC family protein [Gemmatimonadota bacterium]
MTLTRMRDSEEPVSVVANTFAAATILVPDYDEAINYFTHVLRLSLLEDSPRDAGRRWVRVGHPSLGGALLLAVASTPQQQQRIGDQHGGRVGWFLVAADFDAEYNRLVAAGVEFLESPRQESYGRVAVFRDRYGNRWDLLDR